MHVQLWESGLQTCKVVVAGDGAGEGGGRYRRRGWTSVSRPDLQPSGREPDSGGCIGVARDSRRPGRRGGRGTDSRTGAR